MLAAAAAAAAAASLASASSKCSTHALIMATVSMMYGYPATYARPPCQDEKMLLCGPGAARRGGGGGAEGCSAGMAEGAL